MSNLISSPSFTWKQKLAHKLFPRHRDPCQDEQDLAETLNIRSHVKINWKDMLRILLSWRLEVYTNSILTRNIDGELETETVGVLTPLPPKWME